MSINVSMSIQLMHKNPTKLENELIIKKNDLNYINYKKLTNINEISDELKEYPIEYEVMNDSIIIYISGNKLYYPFDLFFKKYKDKVFVTVSDSFDSPYETGLPFFDYKYYSYENGRIIEESESDRVINKIKNIIDDHEDLYTYLYNLYEIYNTDDTYSEDIFNKKYKVNRDSSYDELLVNLLHKFPGLFACLSTRSKNDFNLTLRCLRNNPKVYYYILNQYKVNEQVMSCVLKSDIKSHGTIKEEKELENNIRKILKNNGNYLKDFLTFNASCYPYIKNINNFRKDIDKYLDVQTCKIMLDADPKLFLVLGNEYKENLELAKLYFRLFIERKFKSHNMLDDGVSIDQATYTKQKKMDFDGCNSIKDLYLYILNYDSVPLHKNIIDCMTPNLLRDSEIVLALFKLDKYRMDSSISYILNNSKRLINKKFLRELFAIDLDIYKYMVDEQQNNKIIKYIYLECGGIIEEDDHDSDVEWQLGDMASDELPF